MANPSIDIQAVNQSMTQLPAATPKASANFTEAYFSLALVLGFIIVLAWILKKFGANQKFKRSKHLEIMDAVSVGSKERVLVLKQGHTIMTIGVTASQITLLNKSNESEIEIESPDPLPQANHSAENDGLTANFKTALSHLLKKK